ncbi:MAG: hypothetical protein IPM85_16810 [Chitinophagaceae bacterium]|nr:hypothetical protein [Chitinophagaceae bacterium]
MNNAYAMSLNLEAKQRSRAWAYTGLFAAFMVLLMILVKWPLPKIEHIAQEPGIEVELNLPPEPEAIDDGGGGGGNPVQAAGDPGVAPYSPPAPGEAEPSKSVEDIEDKDATPVTKPTVTQKDAKTITNTSPTKNNVPVENVPAPRTPKAVLGKTTTGTGKGGNNAEGYDKPGGSGTGSGVGNGSGSGGGSGSGSGGGNGSGVGSGNGPKVTRGDRKIVRYYSFTGELDKATIYADVQVSPEGVGKFVRIAKGSSSSSNEYKQAIIQYLQNIRFDKSDHESTLTVQFNFRVN